MPHDSAIAIAAHPDDIEFCMAGTLLLLKQAGYRIHYFSLASGNCGSVRDGARTTRIRRAAEARESARILGAEFHPSITDDLEITYSVELLRRVTAVIRETRPKVVLTHSPGDYMEDHMNTSRLAVSGSFARGMPNFESRPRRGAFQGDTTVYHAMPHGLRDGLGQKVTAGAYVNTTALQDRKREALAAHKSQQDWLDASQKMSSFIESMDDMALEVGRLSKKFRYAEGWRRHYHLGFCGPQADPIREALGSNYLVDRRYERGLEKGI